MKESSGRNDRSGNDKQRAMRSVKENVERVRDRLGCVPWKKMNSMKESSTHQIVPYMEMVWLQMVSCSLNVPPLNGITHLTTYTNPSMNRVLLEIFVRWVYKLPHLFSQIASLSILGKEMHRKYHTPSIQNCCSCYRHPTFYGQYVIVSRKGKKYELFF